MKREGQLMPKIADADNLRLAFWKAAKGKRGKADCKGVGSHLLQLTRVRGGQDRRPDGVSDVLWLQCHPAKDRRNQCKGRS